MNLKQKIPTGSTIAQVLVPTTSNATNPTFPIHISFKCDNVDHQSQYRFTRNSNKNRQDRRQFKCDDDNGKKLIQIILIHLGFQCIGFVFN